MQLSPISFQFIAAGAATQAKGILYRLSPSRTGVAPDWSNSGKTIVATDIAPPITDRSFWQGRYTLAELCFIDDAGTRFRIPDAVCGISRNRNIVTTQMQGHDGTIKEYISDSDWSIEINVGIQATQGGAIVDDYPQEALEEFLPFLKKKSAIRVYSVFFEIFGIDNIVIKSYSLTQATESNYQSLKLSALSDNDDEDYTIYSTDY